jgi:hypothetical protein
VKKNNAKSLLLYFKEQKEKITTRCNGKRNKKIIMIVKPHESNYKMVKSGKKNQ